MEVEAENHTFWTIDTWVTDKPHTSVAYLLGKAPHIHCGLQSLHTMKIIKISSPAWTDVPTRKYSGTSHNLVTILTYPNACQHGLHNNLVS